MEKSNIRKTPFYDLHEKLGGKIVDFAGYYLPLFYANRGILTEHEDTRTKATWFDVSHMGQLIVGAEAASELSSLTPIDVGKIDIGTSKYTVLTTVNGGVIDDCIITNDGERGFYIVVNAARKHIDIPHIRNALSNGESLLELEGWALLAIQGPKAIDVVTAVIPDATDLNFMRGMWCCINGIECRITRCGYTGEDGFEIAIPPTSQHTIIDLFLQREDVFPAGLGARDSLRLEAGLCLYGNELNEETSPIEAGLLWSIPKNCRQDTGYHGANIIHQHMTHGTKKKLVGLLPEGRIPVRSGTKLVCDGEEVGEITSGLFSPTLKKPIAMGYIESAAMNEKIVGIVRGKEINCVVTTLPFVPHQYKR